MSNFILKLFALTAMFIEHLNYVINFNKNILNDAINIFTFCGCIGRISFPIFAFCLAYGWIYSGNKIKYFTRIMICALFSQIPFCLAFYPLNLIQSNNTYENPFLFKINFIMFFASIIICFLYWLLITDKNKGKSILLLFLTWMLPSINLNIYNICLSSDKRLNVLYSFLFAFSVLCLIDNFKLLKFYNKIISIFSILFLLFLYNKNLDYGAEGIFLIVFLHFFKGKRLYQCFTILLFIIIEYGFVYQNFKWMIFACFSILLILFYNPEKKADSLLCKYIFYFFYPIHLLLLGIINIIIKFNF